MQTQLRWIGYAVLPLLALAPVWAGRPAAEGADLYIISPRDAETLHSPITVRFGLKNMGIAPAGTDLPNTGHHHLLIDTELPPLDRPIPSDEHHLHFGKGQTETELHLSPGTHVLQLLLGDYAHTPHVPPLLSDPVRVTILPDPAD